MFHLNKIAKRSGKNAIATLVGNKISIILENKKVVKLTESDLMRLVKRVIKENQNELDDILNGLENTLEKLEFRISPKPNVSKLSVMQKYM